MNFNISIGSFLGGEIEPGVMHFIDLPLDIPPEPTDPLPTEEDLARTE